MLYRVGVDDYINLSQISRFRFTQDNESYKLILFGLDGRVSGNILFFKNDESQIKILNQFIEGIKEITYNPIVSSSGVHYITDEDFNLLEKIKNSNSIEFQFPYKEGLVKKLHNNKCYYVVNDEEKEISKEQYALYYNVYKSSLKGSD